MRQKQLLILNLAFLFGYLLLAMTGGRGVHLFVIALEFSTAWTVFSLTRDLPDKKRLCHYFLIAITLVVRGFLDTWHYALIDEPITAANHPWFYLAYTVPMLLLLLSVICYFISALQRYDHKQLLLDSYKVSLVIIATFGATTIDIYQSHNSFHWSFSLFHIAFAIYTVATCLIVILSLIMVVSRRIKGNAKVFLGIVSFYLLIAGRHIFLTYSHMGVIDVPEGLPLHLLVCGCLLVSITLLYRDKLYQAGKLNSFMPGIDSPENIGKSHAMFYLAAVSTLIWLLDILTTPAFLGIIFFLVILQSMDFLAQQAYAVNEKLKKELTTDSLTGLYNRGCFIKEINLRIEQKKPFTLFFVDLNRFKIINNIHGPQVGDEVLSRIGHRLLRLQSEALFLSRCGGDEFAILLKGNDTKRCSHIANLLIKTIEEPLELDQLDLTMSAGIGLARYPQDTKNTVELLKYADNAMRNAKKQENVGYLPHSSAFAKILERRNQLEIMLRAPDLTKDLSLYFQPQIHTITKQVCGLEALVRWFDREKGAISPGEFIPLAEEIGKIGEISKWVFTAALKQIKIWNEKYTSNLVVNVNVSPISIHNKLFFDDLQKMLEKTAVKPEWVGIEITEHSAMTSPAYMREVLTSVSNLGIKISIDDFGTGYSSLSYLKRFDIDELKIAKELIDNIEHDHDDYHIVNAIIMMAKGLGLKTVAEGVEMREQLYILEDLGCSTIQGYFFDKPMPPEEFERRYLQNNLRLRSQ